MHETLGIVVACGMGKLGGESGVGWGLEEKRTRNTINFSCLENYAICARIAFM